MELNKDIQEFALEMQQNLAAINRKRGWKNAPTEYLLVQLRNETDELEKAIEAFESIWPTSKEKVRRVIEKAAYTANFAMKIAGAANRACIEEESSKPV